MPDIYDDVVHDAQVLVAAGGSLNKALRAALNTAVEQQVDAAVRDDNRGESGEVAEVWRRIGGEFREDVRVSDELVRTMTSFLIGVGRMLRSAAASSTPAGDGRQSVESSGRRSVEIRSSMDQHRDESLRRLTAARPTPTPDTLSGNGTAGGEWDRAKRSSYNSITNDSRPGSVLSMIRDSHTSTEASGRPTTYTALGKRSLSRARGEKELPRLPIPRSAKDLEFPESLDGGDRTPVDGPIRSTRHHSLALPPPLPALPSEVRTKSHTGRLAPKERRISRSSTVPGQPTSPSEATSALSPTAAQSSDIQTSPSKKAFTLTSRRTSSVLNGLQQVSDSLSRKRTISATSEIERPALYSPQTRPPILRKASSSLASRFVPQPSPSPSSRVMSRTTSSSTLSNVSGGSKNTDSKARVPKVRMSLDSHLRSEDDSPPLSAAQRRERRRGNDSYS
jgi:hypothetical protein